MVLAKPYKILSCFVYDWTYAPLKRGQMMSEERDRPKVKKLTKKKPQTTKTNSAVNDENSDDNNSDNPLDYDCTQDDEKEFVHPSHRYR